MKTYEAFHGDIAITEIGRELRKIIKIEKKAFKVLTGYGSTQGVSQSKMMVLKSLEKMKKEGLIQGYFPGEIKGKILMDDDKHYDDKMRFEKDVKSDKDYGNEGIVFIFIR